MTLKKATYKTSKFLSVKRKKKDSTKKLGLKNIVLRSFAEIIFQVKQGWLTPVSRLPGFKL